MQQLRLLAGRYRVLGRLSAGTQDATWIAEEAASKRPVVVVQVTAAKAKWLQSALEIGHPHLATLLRLVDPAPRAELPLEETDDLPDAVAVTELVAGQTLAQALRNGALPTFQAVRCAAHVASALEALHRRGAVHGAVSPRSVLLERSDGGASPVLTQLVERPQVPFASAERLGGGRPSQQDDVWALHVLLFSALTGRLPFPGRSAEASLRAIQEDPPLPLGAFGIIDAKLQALVDRGLAPDPAARTTRILDIETELFSWMSAHPQEPASSPTAAPVETQVNKPPGQEQRETRTQRSPSQRFEPRSASLRHGAPPAAAAQEPRTEQTRGGPLDTMPGLYGRRQKSQAEPAAATFTPRSRHDSVDRAPELDIAIARPQPSAAEAREAADATELGTDVRPSEESVVLQAKRLQSSGQWPRNQTLPRASQAQAVLALHDASTDCHFRGASSGAAEVELDVGLVLEMASSPPPGGTQPPASGVRSPVRPSEPDAAHAARQTQPDAALPPPRQDLVPARRSRPSNEAASQQSQPDAIAAARSKPRVEIPTHAEHEAAQTPTAAEAEMPALAPAVAGTAEQTPQLLSGGLGKVSVPTNRRKSWLSPAVGVAVGLAAAAAMAFVLGRAAWLDPVVAQAPSASAAQAAGVVTKIGEAPRVAVAETPPPGPSQSVSANARADGSPPPAARSKPIGPVAITKCVAALFPPRTFDALQDLCFVCSTPDGKRGVRLMRQRIVLGSGGRLTEGMNEWSRLGWHELAVYAIAREVCCATSEPLVLPPPVGSCPPVDRTADSVAVAFDTRASDLTDRIVRFQRAADCAQNTKAPGFKYPAGPISGGQVVFDAFLKRNGR
ncbi:MAG: protein kinase [Polyangiaceae bacterium]|jgi:hypothetical protein|nr:protein kinase [Polyangiaceae bacterium]